MKFSKHKLLVAGLAGLLISGNVNAMTNDCPEPTELDKQIQEQPDHSFESTFIHRHVRDDNEEKPIQKHEAGNFIAETRILLTIDSLQQI